MAKASRLMFSAAAVMKTCSETFSSPPTISRGDLSWLGTYPRTRSSVVVAVHPSAYRASWLWHGQSVLVDGTIECAEPNGSYVALPRLTTLRKKCRRVQRKQPNRSWESFADSRRPPHHWCDGRGETPTASPPWRASSLPASRSGRRSSWRSRAFSRACAVRDEGRTAAPVPLLGCKDSKLLVQELHLLPGHDLIGDDVRLASQHIDQHDLVAFAVIADWVVDRHLAAAALGNP